MQAPEGIRLTTVAAQLGIKPPMVTTEATYLINRGLIRRIAHHTDGRAKLLVITPKGSKLATVVEHELNSQVGQLFDGLTPDEALTFQKTLQTIIDNYQKLT